MGHHLVYIYIYINACHAEIFHAIFSKASKAHSQPAWSCRVVLVIKFWGKQSWKLTIFGRNLCIYIYDYMEKCTSIYYTYIYIGCSATIQIWEKPEKTRKTFIGKSWNLNPCKLLLWENKREKRWERKPCFWELALTVAHSAWDNFPTEKVWTKTGPWIQWLGCLPKSND